MTACELEVSTAVDDTVTDEGDTETCVDVISVEL